MPDGVGNVTVSNMYFWLINIQQSEVVYKEWVTRQFDYAQY